MQFLRQSTQVIVRVGPFMDATDAVTPETGITLAAADQAEALKAAGAATVDISGNTFAAITGAGGWYDLTLSTTDTNTIGTLDIVVQDTSVCLPVFCRFQVIEEAAYDTLYAASALPASTTNITAGTITTATNVTTVNGLAANVITATSIAADAITAAKIANGAIDAATFAADVDAEILSYVVDDATRIDASALNTASVTTIPAILLDTAEIGAAGAGLTVLATQASVNTLDDLLDTEVAAIKAKTDQLTFTVANVLDANVQNVNDVAIVGDGSGTPFNV
jgi:hypothetical protein